MQANDDVSEQFWDAMMKQEKADFDSALKEFCDKHLTRYFEALTKRLEENSS